MITDNDHATVKPLYPEFFYFVLRGVEVIVLKYEDHVEVWKTDGDGEWHRHDALPAELDMYFAVLDKWSLEYKADQPNG